VHVGGGYENKSDPKRRERHGKVTVSTDVPAFLSPSEEILVCQCTSEWKEYELTGLVNFRKELENMTAGILGKDKIQAIIFTPTESVKLQGSIESAEKNQVKVVTIESLLPLLEQIRNDKSTLGLLRTILSK